MSHNLDFIYDVIQEKDEKFKNKRFLKNDFEDNFWNIEFDHGIKTSIDFNVKLKNGTSLISIKNQSVLNYLKYWIMASTEPEKGVEYASKTIASNIYVVLKLFDYINNNFDLSEKGFHNLSIDFMKSFFDNISKTNNTTNFIYNKKKVLSVFLRKELMKHNKQDLLEMASKSKKIMNIDDFELDLSKEEIICSRVLIKNGLQLKSAFPNMIANSNISAIEFSEQVREREYPHFYRENNESKLSEMRYKSFLRAFMHMKKLTSIKDIKIPDNKVFNEIQNYQVLTKQAERTETVSSELIFETFKKATEFCLEYGEDIVLSYENFIKNYNDNSKNLNKDQLVEMSITSKLKELGVSCWIIKNNENKYKNLRENKSLKSLIDVYYGAVQFIIGTLSARRHSELISLKAFDCVDKENQIIVFKKSKSTKELFGVKDVLSVPMDNLGIEQLLNLEKIQKATNNKTFIFSSPSKIISKHNFKLKYDNFDLFFDYIEMPVIDGKRKYIRQHQLRRFFAMVFFWGNGLGGLDNLRWFMGHTDVKHVYHYITEKVSGSVLLATKAQYAAEHIKDNKTLEKLVKERYNTDNVDIIDMDELTYFIEDLIEEGEVTVEPDFFENDLGEQYQILIKVTEQNNG